MLDFSGTEAFTLPISTLMQLGLYGIAAIYVVFSAILYYHWDTYGTDKKVTATTLLVYFATTIPLLLVMFLMWLTF
tara:strand:- start:4480 stop:4707 length:228 start_codon:yes stop_codon:yes gene_type:complete